MLELHLNRMLQYVLNVLFFVFLSCNAGDKNKNSISDAADSLSLCKDNGVPTLSEGEVEIDSTSYQLKGGYTLSIYPVDNRNGVRVRLADHGINVLLCNSDSCFDCSDWPISNKYAPVFEGIDFDDYFVITSAMYWYLFEKKNGRFIFEARSSSTYDLKNNLLFYGSQEKDECIMLLDLKTFKKVDVCECLSIKNRKNPILGSMNAINLFKITKVTQKYVELIFPNFHSEDEATEEEKPFAIRINRRDFK